MTISTRINKRIGVMLGEDELNKIELVRKELQSEIGLPLSTAAVVRLIIKRYELEN